MAARPGGLSVMLINLTYRLHFTFKVKLKPNLVSVGPQRIATSGNAHVKVSTGDFPLPFHSRKREC